MTVPCILLLLVGGMPRDDFTPMIRKQIAKVAAGDTSAERNRLKAGSAMRHYSPHGDYLRGIGCEPAGARVG